MSNNQQPNAFEDIQQLCRDFRRQLRSGAQKRIEDYLDRVYEDSREMLFQNLLHIDIEYQRRQGQKASSEEYIKRFPQHTRLIRQAFFESTQLSMSSGVETPADEDTVRFGMPAARKLGDYELLRELGRGGFGVVYEARHLKRGDVVALKTLPSLPEGQQPVSTEAERLHKFRREFRSLADINHPNLVGMQTLEVDGRQWFFTMDVIDGTDFLDYVRPQGKLDEDRLRAALSQLADGILALHRRGIVHRDLKPGNVLVDADGHVTIMDFGLVAELQQRTDQTMSMNSRQFAGTPRYAAPEQIMGARTMASDWYAVGTLLYEVLTGEPPFRGSNVELLLHKQNDDAPSLVGRAEIPQDLATLVDQLLRRDPEQRPTGDEIADILCPDHQSRSHDSRSHDSTDSSLAKLSGQSDSLLVGRETQLAELEQARRTLLKTREPLVVFISGRSGEGKTALAETFLQKPRLSDDMVVLSGRCYDRESVPFKAIDCLIDALVAYLRSRPDAEARVLLPNDITMLAQLFPVLRRVTAIAEQTNNTVGIDSRQIRYRAFAALRHLLTTIGQSTPVILFIDDLQWGDADSAAALAEILKPPDAPAVMLLGSYRSDEADESPFLQEWDQRDSDILQTRIEISPLTVEQCAAVLSLRLAMPAGELQEQAQQLWQSARGNPYFLDQLLEGFDPESGQFTAIPLEDIVHQRLSRLPTEATALLEAIAVAGQAVSLTEAAGVTCGMERAFATVTHMRSERLVRLIGCDEQQLVDTYHDKTRETVLEAMPKQQKQQLHVQFGEWLELAEHLTADIALQFLEQDPLLEQAAPPDSDRIFDLAFHFHAAGDDRGFAYQFLAGELSYRAYASEDALEFLDRARKCRPAQQISQRLQFRLHERLGGVHRRLGRLDQAFRHFDEALERAESSLQRAHVYESICTTHIGHSEYRPALDNFDRALRELGLPRPGGISALLRCVPEFLRVLLKPPTWRDQPEGTAEERTRFHIYQRALNSMLLCIWELSEGMASYPYFLLRMQNTARFVTGTEFWGKTVAHSAGQIALNGMPWLGRRLLERTQVAANEIHDVETKGFFLAGSAMANQYSNDRQLADQQYAQGYQLLQKSGTHYYLGAVVHVHRHLHAVIAPSTVELDSARTTLRAAEAIGDCRTQCWGHYDIASAQARAGDIQPALDHIESARRFLKQGERYLTDTIFLGTEGYVRLQASSYEAARFSLEAAWSLIKQRKVLMDVAVRALPWLIESLIGPAWTQPVDLATTKRLRRLCRIAAAMDWLYPNIASPLQRSRGRAYAAMGRSRKAIRCFETAVRRAESFGADYDRARSLLDLAAVDGHGRDGRRAEAIELLKQQESVIPWAERWLLGEPFDPACVAPALDVQNDCGMS